MVVVVLGQRVGAEHRRGGTDRREDEHREKGEAQHEERAVALARHGAEHVQPLTDAEHPRTKDFHRRLQGRALLRQKVEVRLLPLQLRPDVNLCGAEQIDVVRRAVAVYDPRNGGVEELEEDAVNMLIIDSWVLEGKCTCLPRPPRRTGGDGPGRHRQCSGRVSSPLRRYVGGVHPRLAIMRGPTTGPRTADR